jgi:predicted phosphodiesterase
MTNGDVTEAPALADLGALDGDVLVFGGPVSNRQATEAVLAAAAAHGIPPVRVICTGDVAAYCAEPRATADLVRRAGLHVVRGNCEESLGQGADDCGCNFASGSACDALSGAWYRYALSSLDGDTRAWMGARPTAIRFTLAGRTLLAVHGAPSDIAHWIFPSTPVRDKAFEVALAGADGVVVGHSGIPFVETVQGHLWLNAGAAGMPANDGTPRGWYAILSPDGDGRIVVTLHAFPYDHPTAAARMRAAALPEGYARALETGRWPGEDMLPKDERRAAGRPIAAPQHLVWTRASTETTAHAGTHAACGCCA